MGGVFDDWLSFGHAPNLCTRQIGLTLHRIVHYVEVNGFKDSGFISRSLTGSQKREGEAPLEK
jgi:hypothetical protein